MPPALKPERFHLTIPFTEASDEWLEMRRNTMSVATHHREEKAIKMLTRAFMGVHITPDSWKAFIASRPDKWLNFELATLRRLYKWAEEKGYVECNPMRFISARRHPHGSRVKRTVISHTDYLKVLQYLRENRLIELEWMWTCGYECAFAVADSIDIEWSAIDIENLRIKKVRRKMKTRTDQECVVPIDPSSEFFATLMRLHSQRRFRASIYPNTPGGHEFVTPIWARDIVDRGQIDAKIHYACKKICIAAGITPIHWHDLRYTRISMWANTGLIPGSVLARMTGHATEEMLMAYIAPDLKMVSDGHIAANRTAAQSVTCPPQRLPSPSAPIGLPSSSS